MPDLPVLALGIEEEIEDLLRSVHDDFLGPHHLGLYFELIERLTAARRTPHASPVAGAAGR